MSSCLLPAYEFTCNVRSPKTFPIYGTKRWLITINQQYLPLFLKLFRLKFSSLRGESCYISCRHRNVPHPRVNVRNTHAISRSFWVSRIKSIIAGHNMCAVVHKSIALTVLTHLCWINCESLGISLSDLSFKVFWTSWWLNLGAIEHRAISNVIFSAVKIWSCIYAIIGLILWAYWRCMARTRNRDKTSSDSITKQ